MLTTFSGTVGGQVRQVLLYIYTRALLFQHEIIRLILGFNISLQEIPITGAFQYFTAY
jgi:hypothetical protein